MRILKFGGKSLANARCINGVVNIILKESTVSPELTIVCSAFSDTTSRLLYAATLASQKQTDYKRALKRVYSFHGGIINSFFKGGDPKRKVLSDFKNIFSELSEVVNGIYLVNELTPKTLDFVLSFGERFSNYIISEILRQFFPEVEYLDTRKLIKTDDNFGNARVIMDLTEKNIREYFKTHRAIQVATGFIGSTLKNETTTLGRGGSDYTASILGAALDATEIIIYTDVDGLMTTDPKRVKEAFPIKCIEYEEAMELSHFGAKVIYPPSIQPAYYKDIPIRIKNSFNPDFEGTLIAPSRERDRYLIKGISAIGDISLLTIQGSGMVGVAGIASRFFGALARNGINIILITQASSEHSICVAVNSGQVEKAREVVKEEFRQELLDHKIDDVFVERDMSIVAIVGSNMKRRVGISGRLFQALGKNGINVVAIAQGASELNISVVIKEEDEAKALNVIHEAFFLSEKKTLNLFIVGTGLIGRTLINQIRRNRSMLSSEHSLDIRVIALANSRRMLFKEDGVGLESWKRQLLNSGEPSNMGRFVGRMKELNLPNSVFVDCTASDEVVRYYQDILKSHIPIITPNKKACSSEFSLYRDLKSLTRKYGVPFLYETAVGAGLPVISTLRDLLNSGDQVKRIEAVLSGTISFIFNSLKKGGRFSEIIKMARNKGYTEPNPAEDLSGMDVARKVLILAREIGLELEMKDVFVESLLPEGFKGIDSVDMFFKKLPQLDEVYERKVSAAEKKGRVLRYIASIEDGRAEVRLKEVDVRHPFFHLRGRDNIVSFHTKRYSRFPLVVKGPGAGAEVTAAGVLADIIRISNYLM